MSLVPGQQGGCVYHRCLKMSVASMCRVLTVERHIGGGHVAHPHHSSIEGPGVALPTSIIVHAAGDSPSGQALEGLAYFRVLQRRVQHRAWSSVHRANAFGCCIRRARACDLHSLFTAPQVPNIVLSCAKL